MYRKFDESKENLAILPFYTGTERYKADETIYQSKMQIRKSDHADHTVSKNQLLGNIRDTEDQYCGNDDYTAMNGANVETVLKVQ